MVVYLAPFLKGLATMASLVVVIGVQNAFVLRQGLKHQEPFIAASICFLCDTILVLLGAAGLGAVIAKSHMTSLLVAWAGAVFLTYYGLRSLQAAKKAQGLDLQAAGKVSSVAFAAFAVSLLNPHAIIDTVVVVGGLAARYEGSARFACAAGALTASALWFYSLAYGARGLAPLLTRPRIWRYIDLIMGLMMLGLAAGFAWDGLQLLKAGN